MKLKAMSQATKDKNYKHRFSQTFLIFPFKLNILIFLLLSFILNTFFIMSSMRHHFVMEDCNKLAPINKVNQYQLSFTNLPSKIEMMIKLPAMALISVFIIV